MNRPTAAPTRPLTPTNWPGHPTVRTAANRTPTGYWLVLSSTAGAPERLVARYQDEVTACDVAEHLNEMGEVARVVPELSDDSSDAGTSPIAIAPQYRVRYTLTSGITGTSNPMGGHEEADRWAVTMRRCPDVRSAVAEPCGSGPDEDGGATAVVVSAAVGTAA